MPRYAAIVFDLDGTLVHSAPDIHAAAARMLEDLGRPTLSLETVTGFIGNGVKRLVERCVDATGGGETNVRAHALARFEAHYAAAPAALTAPYPHVAELLAELQAAGMPLGVCTNKPQGFAEAVLRDLGLANHLTAIVGGSPDRPMKPDPAPLRYCFERLGVPAADGLSVGDSETDAETAAAAAVPFGLFTGGYRHAPVSSLQARIVFDGFDELALYLVDRARGT